MLGWLVALALYILGFKALDQISRDFSNIPRTRKTWLSLIFWPVATPFAWAGDVIFGK